MLPFLTRPSRFVDVWARLRERAAEVARLGEPCSPQRAQLEVRAITAGCEYEVPRVVRDWLARQFVQLVADEKSALRARSPLKDAR